jgi:hypothetical protein
MKRLCAMILVKVNRPNFVAATAARWLSIALLWLLIASVASPEPAYSAEADLPVLGAPECPWPELSGQRLLDRSLGSIAFSNVAVWQIVTELVRKYGVPISLIEAYPEAKITLTLPSCTLRHLLDAIVAKATGYRYSFVGPHLILYSSDPKWQTRIDNFGLVAGARRAVSEELMPRLRRFVPALGSFGIPWYRGDLDSFVLQDEVRVSGSATVTELLTQVLGERTSAVFAISTLGGSPPASLRLDAAEIVKSIEVTSPTTVLRQNGERIQLKVTGVLRDGTRKDLTPGSCGTRYMATDERIRVGRDGMVAGVSPGSASVAASYDNLTKVLFLEVAAPQVSMNVGPVTSRN